MTVCRAMLCLLLLALVVGCDDVDLGQPRKTSQSTSKQSTGKKSTGGKVAKSGKKEKPGKKSAKPVPLEGATIPRTAPTVGSDGGPSPFANWGGGGSQTEAQAIEQVGEVIRESLDLGPTLVVWGFDRSESNVKLAGAALTAIQALYAEDDIAAAVQEEKLLTAVVGFGEKAEFLLDPPASDSAQVKEKLAAVKTEPGGREATFAALSKALEKYLPVRTKQRREVLLVVVTDEPGDDLDQLDQVIAVAQRIAVPIYVVGPSVPVGKVLPAVSVAGGPLSVSEADKRTYAADSYFADWVSLETSGNAGDTYDSGLGPWGLERLCRKTSGAYLTVGSVEGIPFNNRANREAMKKYAPDYLPLEDMQKLLSESKCRQALVNAAKLPPVKGALVNPQMNFAKQNEAQMKRMLDKAQLDAARLEDGVNKLYDVLAAAESERGKLTGARWQAAYDTAFGRAAAAKVRIDGYNAMLAALKRGKTFEKESSSAWFLERSDTIETGSSFQKLADKAKTYLERVKTDHPGTPWASLAEQELSTPLGWKWIER